MMESLEKTGNEMVDDAHYASDFVQVNKLFIFYERCTTFIYFFHTNHTNDVTVAKIFDYKRLRIWYNIDINFVLFE